MWLPYYLCSYKTHFTRCTADEVVLDLLYLQRLYEVAIIGKFHGQLSADSHGCGACHDSTLNPSVTKVFSFIQQAKDIRATGSKVYVIIRYFYKCMWPGPDVFMRPSCCTMQDTTSYMVLQVCLQSHSLITDINSCYIVHYAGCPLRGFPRRNRVFTTELIMCEHG